MVTISHKWPVRPNPNRHVKRNATLSAIMLLENPLLWVNLWSPTSKLMTSYQTLWQMTHGTKMPQTCWWYPIWHLWQPPHTKTARPACPNCLILRGMRKCAHVLRALTEWGECKSILSVIGQNSVTAARWRTLPLDPQNSALLCFLNTSP